MVQPFAQYIHQAPLAIRDRLVWIEETITRFFPLAEKTFAYQMPTFKQKKNLIHFAYYPKHIGIYPGPKAIAYLKKRYPKLITSKGAWRLAHDAPLTKAVILTLLRYIKANLND